MIKKKHQSVLSGAGCKRHLLAEECTILKELPVALLLLHTACALLRMREREQIVKEHEWEKKSNEQVTMMDKTKGEGTGCHSLTLGGWYILHSLRAGNSIYSAGLTSIHILVWARASSVLEAPSMVFWRVIFLSRRWEGVPWEGLSSITLFSVRPIEGGSWRQKGKARNEMTGHLSPSEDMVTL